MSLQVWLTGNNTMNNQGLLGNLTQTAAPSYVDGKLGKSMSTGGYKMSAAQAGKILNNNAISICFWVYINALTGTTDNRVMLFGNNTNRKFALFNYPSVNDFHWSWKNDSKNYFASGVLSGVLPSYQWTHVAITYQNPNGSIYINGEKVKTFTGVSDSETFEYETQVIYNSSYLYWNDYRIYDHCLSSLEIKQISQGLVCHYKLSCVGNENLIKGCYECYSTNSTRTTTGSLTFTLSSDEMLELKGKTLVFSYYYSAEGERLNADGGLGNRFGIHGSFNYTNTDGTKKQYYPFANYLTTSGTGRAVMTWTVPTDIDTINSNLSFSIQTNYAKPASDNENTWYIKGCKLEIGSNATSWCPNKNDTLYSTLGYDDNIEYDCSGYGNNGIRQGNITWSSNTPRYSGSYGFDGSSSYINCGKGGKVTEEITVNIWGYMNDWSTYSGRLISCTETGGWNFEPKNSYMNFPIGTGVSANSYLTTTSNVTLNSLSSGWHMFTGTYNGFSSKIYIDGEISGSANGYTEKTPIYYNKNNNIFIGAEAGGNTTPVGNYFNGNISDVRIYATALSATDIKQLYEVSASIDKSGILAAYEFVEEG